MNEHSLFRRNRKFVFPNSAVAKKESNEKEVSEKEASEKVMSEKVVSEKEVSEKEASEKEVSEEASEKVNEKVSEVRSALLASMRDLLQLDPHKQYDERGIDVPCVRAKGKHFKALSNMENAKKGVDLNEMRLYNEAFAHSAERMSKSVDALFK